MKLFIEENNTGENILYLIVDGHDTHDMNLKENMFIQRKI